MLLRICLILAILAGLAVIGLTHFQVRPHVKQIIDTRDENKRKWDEFEGRWKKSQRELKLTQETLQKTQSELDDTKVALVAANTKATEQQKRADDLRMVLDQTKAELTSAQQQLAAWVALGLPVDQIASVIQSQRKLAEANEALELEKKVLVKAIMLRDAKIRSFLNPNADAPLPDNLRGRVVAVDPKWDFVVLDVGADDGALVNGVMMVSRDSKLIGKVRLTDVQDKRSIANIVPGWKLGDVSEGDIVVPQ